MTNCIYPGNRRFEYYGSYTFWRDAYNEGRRMKRKYNCHFFIVKRVEGVLFPVEKNLLYLSRGRR